MSDQIITFEYRNHRGKIGWRTIEVESIEYIREPGFGYQPGWFICGRDIHKQARRSFSLDNIVLPASVDIFKLLRLI